MNEWFNRKLTAITQQCIQFVHIINGLYLYRGNMKNDENEWLCHASCKCLGMKHKINFDVYHFVVIKFIGSVSLLGCGENE